MASHVSDTSVNTHDETSSKFNICSINVGGLYSKLNNTYFELFCKNFDVICISETKTNCYDFTDTLLHEYDIFEHANVNLGNYFATHGICVLVRKHLAKFFKIIEGKSSKQVLWIKVDESVIGNDFILGAVYLPCESSIYYDKENFDDIQRDIIDFDLPICIIGDWNARTAKLKDVIDYDDYVARLHGLNDVYVYNEIDCFMKNKVDIVRKNNDQKSNTSGSILCELCHANNICILNGRYGSDRSGSFTCFNHNNGKSSIDYAVMSPKLFDHLSDFQVHEFDKLLSDTHCAISLSLNYRPDLNVKELLETVNKQPDIEPQDIHDKQEFIFKWNGTKPDEFQASFTVDAIESLCQNLDNVCDAPSQNSINDFYSKLSKIVIEKAVNVGAYVVKKKTSVFKKDEGKQPWFDVKCFKARENYHRVRNKMKFVNPETRNDKIKSASKRLKETITHTKKLYYKRLHNKLRILKSNNSKDYWNYLNKVSGRKGTECNIELDVLRDHFKNLNENAPHQDDIPNAFTNSDNEELNNLFTLKEIECVIKTLKLGKACGLDKIRNEFLKKCPVELLNIIVKYFNLVLNTGIVPEEWCIGVIVPIYKNKGSSDNPDNYRGITLLSCVGKLFTALLNKRLTSYLDAVGGIGDEQAGFREGYSTMDHVFTLYAIIEMYLAKGKRLYCAFIDYKKAFDMVNRTSLWKKMLSLGINGKLLNVIKNMYSQAKSCVKKNSLISDYFSCNVGVRQGENLSPMLFAIFLNDFEYSISRNYNGLGFLAFEVNKLLSDEDVEHFLRLFALLYADDTIVMAESAEQLQLALDAVHKYCSDWDLTVNTTKTKIVIFSRKKVTNYPAFLFGHNGIDVVEDYTYLGVIFNYNGLFSKAINKQAKQGMRAFYALLNKVRKLRLPVDLAFELFDHLVLPVFLYGCEVWGFSNIDQLEVLHRKFIKIILGVCTSTPNCMIYGESGRRSVRSIVDSRMISFYARVVNGKHCKLSYVMLTLAKKKQEKEDYFCSWTEHIKFSLGNLGMNEIWLLEGNGCSTEYIKRGAKLRLNDIHHQEWHENVSTHEFCDFYKLIKKEWGKMNYLNELCFYQRKLLSKWRCRSNYLPISSSRFVISDDILCPLCKGEHLGDELHYLSTCPFFNEERNLYLSQISNNFEIEVILDIFRTDQPNPEKLQNLISFIKIVMYIFDHRKEWDKEMVFEPFIFDEDEEI